MKLPKEIIMYIYSFDSKYHLKYKDKITYNNVICFAKLSTIF